MHVLFFAHENVHFSHGNYETKNTTGIVIATGKTAEEIKDRKLAEIETSTELYNSTMKNLARGSTKALSYVENDISFIPWTK